MIVFYVLLAVALIIALGYFFLPFFKKSKVNIFQKLKEKRIKKKELKIEKKKIKIENKKFEKENKEEIVEEKAVEAVEQKQEDPDVKVNENNLEYDGFFENDFSNKEELIDNEDDINSNLDDLFDDLFSDTNYNKKTDDFYRAEPDDDFDLNDINFDEFGENQDDISNVIKNLPPEVKVMLLSNVLDRKDNF